MDRRDSDDEGHIVIHKDEFLRKRYRVLGVAGQGTFGKVLDVLDTKYNDRVALKVIRSVPRYLEAAIAEIRILDKIREKDTERKSLCVRLYTNFEITHRKQRHMCMGFEKLGRSLYEFIKKNKYRGFQMHHVRDFSEQLLTAVAFCHSINLIHTDLKPENILLVKSEYTIVSCGDKGSGYRYPTSSDIRLIDFGGATFEHEHHSRIINTRQYRSPEVLLGVGWSYPSDLWSVGCILAELVTGELLFATHEDLEHLALIEKIIGKRLPQTLIDRALEPYRDHRTPSLCSSSSSSWRSRSPSRCRSGSRDRSRKKRKRWHKHRKEGKHRKGRGADKLLRLNDGRLRWPDNASSAESIRHVNRMENIDGQFDDQQFKNLLYALLEADPDKRITAAAALKHPFLTSSSNYGKFTRARR